MESPGISYTATKVDAPEGSSPTKMSAREWITTLYPASPYMQSTTRFYRLAWQTWMEQLFTSLTLPASNASTSSNTQESEGWSSSVGKDNIVSFSLYRDAQESENEKIENGEFYTVQVFRSPQDLSIFAKQGADPRWENVGSYVDIVEAEAKYYESKKVYVKVRMVLHEMTVLGEQ